MQGELTGIVTTPDTRELTDLAAIVFPVDRTQRAAGSWRLRGPVSIDKTGRFRVLNLPDGEYWVAVVPNVRTLAEFGPQLCESLENVSVKVSFRAGDRNQVTLKVQ